MDLRIRGARVCDGDVGVPRPRPQCLPPDHRIFNIKHRIHSVECRRTLMKEMRDAESRRPFLEAVVIDGRAALVYSKFDFGCAFEGFPCGSCRGLKLPSAEKLVTNILLYAMTE